MAEPLEPNGRGALLPNRLPTRFRRVPAAPVVAHLVQWWWISEWDIPDGQASQQHTLAFPVCNLVAEADRVTFCGPTTRASTQELVGQGQALAALLQPAATPAFTRDARRLQDCQVLLDEPALQELARTRPLEEAIPDLASWLLGRVGQVEPDALLANEVYRIAATDPEVTTVPDLAASLHISQRTLHRITDRFVGLTPYAMIRRRRLQDAAEHIRAHPDAPLGEVAAANGFSDQAHLSREFRKSLGWTPSAYRGEV